MLIEEINRYIALRRSLGFKLKETAKNLASFGQFVEARGERHVRTATAVAWAEGASTPDTRYRRITDVIRLATFLHAEDAAHEIPPGGIFKAHRTKFIPYIFTDDELARLIVAARVRQLNESSPVRREIYAVLFGLIASTGLRISEALNLTLSDVLPDGILHIRKTKFGKSRMVPLHPSVMPILDRYHGAEAGRRGQRRSPLPFRRKEENLLLCPTKGVPRNPCHRGDCARSV
jgi:integrase/recombinase XerD